MSHGIAPAANRNRLQALARETGASWDLRHDADGWSVRVTLPPSAGGPHITIESSSFSGSADAVERATQHALELLATQGVGLRSDSYDTAVA